jgi:hypothetical protein
VSPLSGRARRHAARARAGGQAADLGAIRRSEEIIEMLASRRVVPPALADPVVALLGCFTADIDGAVRPAGRRGGQPRRGAPRHRATAARRAGDAWPHAAAAAAVAAAIAMLTAVAAAVLVVAGWVTRR